MLRHALRHVLLGMRLNIAVPTAVPTAYCCAYCCACCCTHYPYDCIVPCAAMPPAMCRVTHLSQAMSLPKGSGSWPACIEDACRRAYKHACRHAHRHALGMHHTPLERSRRDGFDVAGICYGHGCTPSIHKPWTCDELAHPFDDLRDANVALLKVFGPADEASVLNRHMQAWICVCIWLYTVRPPQHPVHTNETLPDVVILCETAAAKAQKPNRRHFDETEVAKAGAASQRPDGSDLHDPQSLRCARSGPEFSTRPGSRAAEPRRERLSRPGMIRGLRSVGPRLQRRWLSASVGERDRRPWCASSARARPLARVARARVRHVLAAVNDKPSNKYDETPMRCASGSMTRRR